MKGFCKALQSTEVKNLQNVFFSEIVFYFVCANHSWVKVKGHFLLRFHNLGNAQLVFKLTV